MVHAESHTGAQKETIYILFTPLLLFNQIMSDLQFFIRPARVEDVVRFGGGKRVKWKILISNLTGYHTGIDRRPRTC